MPGTGRGRWLESLKPEALGALHMMQGIGSRPSGPEHHAGCLLGCLGLLSSTWKSAGIGSLLNPEQNPQPETTSFTADNNLAFVDVHLELRLRHSETFDAATPTTPTP